jgi:hypothetical protein
MEPILGHILEGLEEVVAESTQSTTCAGMWFCED